MRKLLVVGAAVLALAIPMLSADSASARKDTGWDWRQCEIC